ARAGIPSKLHVPSPDWRDQIIYFLLTDRFNDGDASNNDQGAGEFDPANGAKYSGGDLRGIVEKLDYIRGLGATAVWLTPPVANRWWDQKAQFSGYHGYWAEHFMQVDKHCGTLADYQALSHRLHMAGMYLVQDIVLNHTADFFDYRGGYDMTNPARFFTLNPDARGLSAPSQWPFSLNDATNPDHRRAAIYHWTPAVSNYQDTQQVLNFQMSGLDDLNTENPLVRRALRESYGYWIKSVGVDAFRVDTAFYVPPASLSDFLYAKDARYPGMKAVAAATGRRAFHVFGEGFAVDKPYADEAARKIERYMTSANGQPVMPGMLNFPLYGSLGDVFARGQPTAVLGHRIRSQMKLHQRLHWMPTFVDNHDVDRFLAGGSVAGLKQGLLLLMTLPGIPVIYYGTEQGFTESRAAMFKTGFGSGGRDHFDTAAPLYQFIQRATALRRSEKLFSRGIPDILHENAAAPGALAYRMRYQGESAVVAFNSADTETLIDNLDLGVAPGTVLKGLFAIDGTPADLVVGATGRLTLKLPARSGMVWKVSKGRVMTPSTGVLLKMDRLPKAPIHGDFEVSGRARGLAAFKLVVDGDVANAVSVTPDRDGHWQATVDTSKMISPDTQHRLVAWADAPMAVSAAASFRVSRDWVLLAEVDDASGDDSGPDGRYRYPADAGWLDYRQADIQRVQVYGAGGNLRVDLTMNRITRLWNPPNGFDHVAFTLFIEVPGNGEGATVMPLQNATLPAGMRWHYRLRAHGWSNALFSSQAASASQEGTAVAPTAEIRTDPASSKVSFIFPAAALGSLKSLSGLRLYVTTWDYDGGFRNLTTDGQANSFSGGDGAVEPLVMDDTAVIKLP
ncbi:MAG: alpha-amylase, partial [Betaproteobacteria bacterium]|nr:alpha-amylase [Betaproteobacteria bacterium]